MKTYLCAVSPQLPENYQLGLQAQTWGVERRYRDRIAKVRVGDELIFLSGVIKSIHRIESQVFEDDSLIWPPKDGDRFPFRIRINAPLYRGALPSKEFVPNISFMRDKEAWGGTIQGASGVFNDRLTNADVDFIKSRLHRITQPEPEAARVAEQPRIQNLFRIVGADVLESLKRLLPALGLTRYNGSDFPAEYDLGYGGNVILCRDRSGDLAIVDFNRGEVPSTTLIRVLHYMSWARQTLAKGKDVRGIILAESADDALFHIVKEFRTSPCASTESELNFWATNAHLPDRHRASTSQCEPRRHSEHAQLRSRSRESHRTTAKVSRNRVNRQ